MAKVTYSNSLSPRTLTAQFDTMHVLLIDDRHDHNYLNEIIISDTGLFGKIHAVTSGKEALEYLQKTNEEPTEDHPFPEIIFLDINMPIMNGWEFLDEFGKLIPKLNVTPKVFMLSTSSYHKDIVRSEEYGAVSGFITKPLDDALLTDLHSKYCDSFGKNK